MAETRASRRRPPRTRGETRECPKCGVTVTSEKTGPCHRCDVSNISRRWRARIDACRRGKVVRSDVRFLYFFSAELYREQVRLWGFEGYRIVGNEDQGYWLEPEPARGV